MNSRHDPSNKLERLLFIERDIQANLSRGSVEVIEFHRKEKQKLIAEIGTAIYLQNWLIDHKICCNNKNCLCNSSTPFDALAELYEKTGNDDIAESLRLSNDKITEVKLQLVKSVE